jgi:hypothetical protein
MDRVPHHLLTLWNPSYAADAMDEHLRVLLDWAGRWRRGEAPDDEVYVWWGRLRSPNRKGALPHADAIGALDAQIRSGAETHLYLTDYRSLYVAHLRGGDLGAPAPGGRRRAGAHAPLLPEPVRRLLVPPVGHPAAGGRRHAGGDRGAEAPEEHPLPRPARVALRGGWWTCP